MYVPYIEYNRKYGELSYPKNQKMCNPILVTRPMIVNPVVKMRPRPVVHPH